MKQSRWMRGTGLALLAALTLLPMAAGAAQLAQDDDSSLLARGGNGGGRGGYGTGSGTAPQDGTGNGAKTGDCVNS